MKKYFSLTLIIMATSAIGQELMTPETLWKLNRLSPVGLSSDGKSIVYKVSTPVVDDNKFNTKYFKIPVTGGTPVEIDEPAGHVADKNVSPNGRYVISVEEVKIEKILGTDRYADVPKSNAQVYDGLNYRHWDTWNDGTYKHLMFRENRDGAEKTDIMAGEPFDAPQKPFGGEEDYVWSPDAKRIIYVSKKKSGTAYAISTNTDLYEYNVETQSTRNLTEGMMGYDTHPAFSPQGYLTWLSMRHDGYESDKNDLLVSDGKQVINLTSDWDGTVDNYLWAPDGKRIYFTAPVDGTKQVFEVNFSGFTKKMPAIRQLTQGQFDVNDIVGVTSEGLILTRTDMNHAAELFLFESRKQTWKQISNVNKEIYDRIAMSKVEKRYVTTTDGKKMLVWVILPPNFDKNKKYPALLYCQGGPQSALTQYYSFRWNFQLMAAQGYVVIAPNRRGMPGHGVKWNEQISTDWGGQVMQDYLSAVDEIANEPYIDRQRLGCVGASYGGYSVFYLAGIHGKRFKSFIAHNGVFNLKSMYGTTEEVFFTNWDLGGPYWEKDNAVAQNSYLNFNPIDLVANWDTPILIYQGGKDYRVPIGQGQEAFQAAQLRGVKSRFVYFPDENHWILKPQNALVWQREFFNWLRETL